MHVIADAHKHFSPLRSGERVQTSHHFNRSPGHRKHTRARWVLGCDQNGGPVCTTAGARNPIHQARCPKTCVFAQIRVQSAHRVRTAADPRETAAFPRRAPSCVGLLPTTSPLLAIPPRGFFAQSPRRQLKTAKTRLTEPSMSTEQKIRGYNIIADADSINSRSVGGGRLACSGLFFRALPRISGKCQKAR